MATQEQQAIEQAKQKAAAAAPGLLQKQSNALDKMAKIRVAIVDGVATQAERTAYYEAKKEYDSAEAELAAAGSLSSDEVKRIKEEQRQRKLSRLKGKAGTLTSAKPGDLFEYVLRTQALNPYSRERACDLEFMDLLSKVAQETSTDIKRIEDLKALIRDSVSGN